VTWWTNIFALLRRENPHFPPKNQKQRFLAFFFITTLQLTNFSFDAAMTMMHLHRFTLLRCLSSSSLPDYFSQLGVTRSFRLDAGELQTTYRNLMAKLHPDRHTRKSAEEQAQVADQASRVTNAYSVLQKPHQRAVHLLDLYQKPLDEKSSGDLVGMEFLMNVMELREEISETEDQGVLKTMKRDNQERIDKLCEELEGAFEEEDLETALVLTAKLQYWNRIDETIKEQMDE
jgi:Fe-S protein assembly co-chaperone HscB